VQDANLSLPHENQSLSVFVSPLGNFIKTLGDFGRTPLPFAIMSATEAHQKREKPPVYGHFSRL
jgi:hypothetical protein